MGRDEAAFLFIKSYIVKKTALLSYPQRGRE
jgi:hypothetical protein